MSAIVEYENLVLEGGGVKGAAEVGALVALDESGILRNIKRYAGSSIGALICGLLACGATPLWLQKKMNDLDFNQLSDNSWGFLRDIYRMYRYNGWNKGFQMVTIIKNLLQELNVDPNITLKQIYNNGKELRITTTLVFKRQNMRKIKLLWLDHISFPNLKLCDAIRMSAGFPYFFQSVKFLGADAVDGAVLLNYPISAFDDDLSDTVNNKTLGIRLLSQPEYNDYYDNNDELEGVYPSVNIKEFTESILDGLLTIAQQKHEKTEDFNRSIAVDTGNITAMNLNLTSDQKQWLFDQGYNAAKQFINLSVLDQGRAERPRKRMYKKYKKSSSK